jgi:immune inhibitor A
MKPRAIRIVTTLAILLGPLSGAVPALAAPPGPTPIDVGPEIREWDADASRLDLSAEALAEVTASPATTSTPLTSCTLATKIWLILNDFTGAYQLATFDLVAESDMSQIWVQRNLAWPTGDPRLTPEIFCEQAEYMLGEFDDNIYPTEIDFFGTPDAHDGSNSTLVVPSLGIGPGYYDDPAGRQVVLVSNIRDDNYYDPTYPLYIAGFYSPSFEFYFDRNVMSIDAFDWADRTGPDGSRPFLYEGVFAHEYQHLLHDDYDSDEESWVNEGLSDFAELLTGYGHPDSHVQATADLPENSLVVWGDQGDLEILSDYGHAYMFMLYLKEQFGDSVLQDLFLEPANSISGVNAALAGDTGKSFADVYHDYAIALLIDSKKAGGQWEYKSLQFNLDVGTPESPNPEAYDTPGAPPWGTDYLWIDSYLEGHSVKDVIGFSFNGLDYTTFPTAWSSDGDVLYSGAGDLLDNWAIFETPGGGTLSFDTAYDAEEFWDFGFVQVSTDGGHTWTSLANGYTTTVHDPSAHPKIVENVPGLTGCSGPVDPVTLICSLDTISMSFDLSPYAGQDILVAFRYVTDWAFTTEGWYIDNVYVDSTLISDGSDASVFSDITEILPINNDFTLTFVGIKTNGNGNSYKIASFDLDSMTEAGVTNIRNLLKDHTDVILMVTFDAPEGFTAYADYDFEFLFKENGPDK